MGHASEPRLLVMHALRLKGFAEIDVMSELCGLEPDAIAPVLDELTAAGEVTRRDGRISGFLLTPEGRRAGEGLLADELDRAGARPTVASAYERFCELNTELLSVCTAWQLRDVGGVTQPNDHLDAGYDVAVIGRLVELHDAVRPVCADLRDVLDRFSSYSPRLRTAVEKVAAGDHDYFTKPMIPSYHTVWFELHEDLLATLGIDRANEGAS